MEINNYPKYFKRIADQIKHRSVMCLKGLNPIAYKVYIALALFALILSLYVLFCYFPLGSLNFGNNSFVSYLFGFVGDLLIWLAVFLCFELIVMMVFHYLLPWLTNKTTLCEPIMLCLDNEVLALKFNVYEQVSRTPLPRKGYSIKFDDDVEYTFFINKSSLRSLSIDKDVCRITGASLIYLPKFIYTAEKTNYNSFDKDYHIKMHDMFINDDDFGNRDETYPWIIKRDEFSFIFMFDDDAKQTLLEWSKK